MTLQWSKTLGTHVFSLLNSHQILIQRAIMEAMQQLRCSSSDIAHAFFFCICKHLKRNDAQSSCKTVNLCSPDIMSKVCCKRYFLSYFIYIFINVLMFKFDSFYTAWVDISSVVLILKLMYCIQLWHSCRVLIIVIISSKLYVHCNEHKYIKNYYFYKLLVKDNVNVCNDTNHFSMCMYCYKTKNIWISGSNAFFFLLNW